MTSESIDDRLGAYRGMRVLVTGGSGFIGSHLTARLVDLGAQTHVLTSAVSSVYPPRLSRLRSAITLHEGSLDDASAIRHLFATTTPEVVFHLGAYTHVGKSWTRVDECIQANVQGTINLIHAMTDHPVQRMVNTGTSEIYGDIAVPFHEDATPNPVSPYAVSKFAAEMYCRLYSTSADMPIVRVRPFNAYGPAQSPDRVIPEIIVRALQSQELLMTTGTQTREFNFVADLVDGFLLAGITPGIDGMLLNLGNGDEISMADLVARILDLMGNPIEAQIGALPDRPIEIWRMYCDATRARETLGWTPRHSLDEGLARTIEWYEREIRDNPRSPFIPGFAHGR